MVTENEENKEISRFNPAQHKMNRINSISENINASSMNLEAWNIELCDWNYNIYFKALVRLYHEVYTKFSDDEKEECEIIRRAIEKSMEDYPVREKLKRGWGQLNTARLRIFKRYIEEYEKIVKKYQNEHGLDTPNMEDDEGI